MSSYSFSHQFYQHWTSAPQAIRAAIVQELQDITTLLQTDIPFEKFVFSNHDLDAHLDDLYGAHDKQQAKELTDKPMALKAETEQKRLEEERLEKTKQQVEQETLAKKESKKAGEPKSQQESGETMVKACLDSQENATMSNDSSKNAPIATLTEILNHAVTDDESEKASTDIKTSLSNSIQAIADQDHKNAAINISLPDSELNKEHQQMIQELEVQIDDYLTEQMMQMSENLKSWLRAEVTRQLSEK